MKKLFLAMSVFTLTFTISCTNESNEPMPVQQEKSIDKTMSKDGDDEIIYYTDESPLAQNIADDMARSTGLDIGGAGKCKTTASVHVPSSGATIYHVVCGTTHWIVVYDISWHEPVQENPRDYFFHHN